MIRYTIKNFMRGIKMKIYPTEDQKAEIEKNIDIARAVYNIGLYIQKTNYDSGNRFIPYFDMINKFNEMKRTPEYNWLNDVSVGTIQCALQNLDNAYNLFFKKASNFPIYKRKKAYTQSVSMRSDRTRAHGEYFKVSGISGHIYAKNHIIRDDERLYDIAITRDGYGNYWLSFSRDVPTEVPEEIEYSEPIGIDVGIRNMITTSNGDYYHFSDTSKLERRRARKERRVSKYRKRYLDQASHTKTKYEDIPKSKNYLKAAYEAVKISRKIWNKRRDDIHKATRKIVDSNPESIVIEDLSVQETISNQPWMKKFMPQMLFYQIHKQIRYKSEEKGIKVITAPKDYASSQICSSCGYQHKIYGAKTFICPVCGLRIDRDLNAAINLRNLA